MIRFRGLSFLFYGLILLILPVRWVLAVAFSVFVHEFCHCLAILLTGNRVLGMEFSCTGILLHSSPLTVREELICALAGPLGSFLLVLCCLRVPRIAICAGIQGMFNLLPIGILDGGRVLHCLLRLVVSDVRAEILCDRIQSVLLLLITAAGIGAGIRFSVMDGIIPLLSVFLGRCLSEKFLAKKGRYEYNTITKKNEVLL